MKELEELKKNWKLQEDTVNYSEPELQSIFEIKTKRSVGNINRSMLVDGLLMLIATMIFIGISFFIGLKDRYIISAELIFVTIILAIHYRIKYITFNRLTLESNDIKTAVQKLIHKVSNYILLYKCITPAIAGGLYLWYSAQATFYKTGSYPLLPNTTNTAIAVVIATIALLLTHLITGAMYGKEIKRLKNISANFTENDAI